MPSYNFDLLAPSIPVESNLQDVFETPKEFAEAALYSGVVQPLKGLAQIGAELTGNKTLEKVPQALERIGLTAPEQGADSLSEGARMLGSAVGTMLPYLLLHKAIGSAAGKIMGEEAATAAGVGLSGGQSFNRVLAKEAVVSFSSGFVLDAFLKPSEGGHGIAALAKGRAGNGIAGGVTMAVLSGTSLGLGRLGESAALRGTVGSALLRNPITAGVISAVPAGLVSAESSAVRKDGKFAKWSQVKTSIDQMAFVGAALGGARVAGLMGGGAAAENVGSGDAIVVASIDKVASLSRSEALRTEPIVNLESPTQRAERLGLPADMERSKALLFGQVNHPDGTKIDVVVRPFASGANSALRVYRANLAEQLGTTIKSETGIDGSALPMVLRDNFTLPDMNDVVFDWNKTTTEPVIVQENGGMQFGTQLREWALERSGKNENGELPTGSITDLINNNAHVRALVGRAAFDNMFKGNIDLVEFSQQTIKEGAGSTSLDPAGKLNLVAIDNKNDFTLAPRPSWGFGSQFGLTLEVAKALEGKPLDQVTPGLRSEAETLNQMFTSEAGRQKLVAAGLTGEETAAASIRLQSLIDNGFPMHLGESNHYEDAAQTKLTASLTGAYDKETEDVSSYLQSRDHNLKVIEIDGHLRIVKGD